MNPKWNKSFSRTYRSKLLYIFFKSKEKLKYYSENSIKNKNRELLSNFMPNDNLNLPLWRNINKLKKWSCESIFVKLWLLVADISKFILKRMSSYLLYYPVQVRCHYSCDIESQLSPTYNTTKRPKCHMSTLWHICLGTFSSLHSQINYWIL